MSQVIGFHYTLKNKIGVVLDSSDGRDPLLFLAGRGHILPKLEEQIADMAVGDSRKISLSAEDGYGPVNEELQLTVKRSQFPEEADLKPGVQFQVNNEQGSPVFTIKKIDGEDVHIDGNHPMAGVDLHFDIEITEKRDATAEEIAHGHAHGPGGHHH